MIEDHSWIVDNHKDKTPVSCPYIPIICSASFIILMLTVGGNGKLKIPASL